MEGFAYKFIQNRIFELRREEEGLLIYLKDNISQCTMDTKANLKEKICNLRNERERLSKALEYELGVR